MKARCESVTVAGRAAPGCAEVTIETFTRATDGKLINTGSQCIPVKDGCFRIKVVGEEISCVRVVGAGSVDECDCGPVEPPRDCGCGPGGGGYGGGGSGNPPPTGSGPCWGNTGDDGWQCYEVPFTLPLTLAQWPARYFGAPDPSTTAPGLVEEADLKEATRRLGGLALAGGMSQTRQLAELRRLRNELVRLVQGYPSTLLADIGLNSSPAGANAPDMGFNLMQLLLFLALDPYFARVLGLYFVDQDAKYGVAYDYCITGYWGSTACASDDKYPGLAPAAPLARGSALFDGMTITPSVSTSSLWRWTRDDANGNYRPQTDPNAPGGSARR